MRGDFGVQKSGIARRGAPVVVAARVYPGCQGKEKQCRAALRSWPVPAIALAVSLGLLGGGPARATEPAQRAASEPPKRLVIPFDFDSKFDNGEYGQNLGEMFWAKIKREGGFILPESMQEVRDWCERSHFIPSADTPLPRMKEIVVKEQAGDIGIWGKIERVPGFETDVYDLWINIADFTATSPRIIYRKKARTQTVGEIPHVYVKEALDRLYGRTPTVAAAPNLALAERWKTAPNLVKGDFEQGQGSPAGWDKLPHDVTWVKDKGSPGKAVNHVIRFSMNEDVAGTTGALYYSEFFPVEEGATYRFQCRWKTTGSAAKVFVKCYDELPTEFRTGSAINPNQTEKREVYRSQQNLQGNPGVWNVQTEDFTPTHTQFTPRWGRVMLYAYWPAGVVEWDDVIVKQVALPPSARGKKDRRPSMETKVRSRDIEERERALRPDQNAPARNRAAPTFRNQGSD
jgi:hypothetical protein